MCFHSYHEIRELLVEIKQAPVSPTIHTMKGLLVLSEKQVLTSDGTGFRVVTRWESSPSISTTIMEL